MFCSKCGTEMPDGSAFCPQCGKKVVDLGNAGATIEPPVASAGAAGLNASNAPIAPEGAAGSAANDAPGGPGATIELPVAPGGAASSNVNELSGAPGGAAGPAPKKSKRTAILVAVAVAVIVIAAVGIGLWWKADQDAKAAEKAAWELAHTGQVTEVSAETPAFDSASTPIPVQVKGSDLDGNAVDEMRFLKSGSMQVETLAGSYDLSFPAGYITGEGKVYKSPGATQHIDVAQPTDGSKAAAQVVQAGAYVEVGDLEVTDELINEIADLAKQDPDDNGKAESLKKKASDNHQAAVKAEEERKAAEAEAARVEARKAQIEDTARAYVNALYNGGNWVAYVSPRPNGVGSPPYDLISIDSLYAIDENTVFYEVTYKVKDSVAKGTSNYRKEQHETKTLYFTPDGMIDSTRRN